MKNPKLNFSEVMVKQILKEMLDKQALYYREELNDPDSHPWCIDLDLFRHTSKCRKPNTPPQ